MTRGPIEGVSREGEDELPKGIQAWDRYLRHAEEEEAASERAAAEAAEAEARALGAQQPAPPPPPPPKSAAAGAVAGAVVTLKNLVSESPVDHREGVLAALQAEALARLEIPIRADESAAAQRAADAADPAQVAAGRELGEARRTDREERDPEAPASREPNAPRPAPDGVVAPARKLEAEEPSMKRRPGTRQG